jgi:hypothetical protein
VDLSTWLRNQWDRAGALALLVVGLVALLLGWLGVSREGLPAAQIPYLASGALLGLFALGAAATMWLSADLRDLWRKFDDIHRDLSAQAAAAATSESDCSPAGSTANGAQRGIRAAPLPSTGTR